jgi:hypothetical protein
MDMGICPYDDVVTVVWFRSLRSSSGMLRGFIAQRPLERSVGAWDCAVVYCFVLRLTHSVKLSPQVNQLKEFANARAHTRHSSTGVFTCLAVG